MLPAASLPELRPMNRFRWLIAIPAAAAIGLAGWRMLPFARPVSPATKPTPALSSAPSVRVTRAARAAEPAVPAETRRAAPAAWAANWHWILDQSSTPERDAALASALQELTRTDPEAATEQLLELHPTDRTAVVAAALADAARRTPDDAIREAIRFCDEDPAYSLEYGRSLISVLAETGDYRSALNFVLAEDSVGWLGENGSKWLTGLFDTWAKAAPAQAAQEAWVASPGLRGEALQAVAGAWVKSDPVALANFVWELPAGADRGFMLDTALRGWTEDDPMGAADWMDHHKAGSESGPELDAGGAALAAHLAGEGRNPAAAVRWAAGIFDHTLRAGTLAMVLRSWASADRDAALNYIMSSPAVRPEDRAGLLNELAQPRAAY
jgi:hypothetical protein